MAPKSLEGDKSNIRLIRASSPIPKQELVLEREVIRRPSRNNPDRDPRRSPPVLRQIVDDHDLQRRPVRLETRETPFIIQPAFEDVREVIRRPSHDNHNRDPQRSPPVLTEKVNDYDYGEKFNTPHIQLTDKASGVKMRKRKSRKIRKSRKMRKIRKSRKIRMRTRMRTIKH